MAWFADLAGKAESLLNNLDEQTGAALRNHNAAKPKKNEKAEFTLHPEQKRRPMPRTARKSPPITETRSNNISTRKLSPPSRVSRSQTKDNYDSNKSVTPRTSKSPPRHAPVYSLNNCPRTLVGDIKDSVTTMDQFGLKRRRYSLPSDLEVHHNDSFSYKMENLEVENEMLKNELNVMNREVSELLERLRIAEDGNNVVRDEELSETQAKLHNADIINHRVIVEKDSLSAQLELLKTRINDLTSVEFVKYKERNKDLELEVNMHKERNKDLEEFIRQLNDKRTEKESHYNKLENEIRHAQTTISDLQGNLEKSTAECRRLEKDWDTYKQRVKSMLYAKDKEIKALQEGLNLTEDTKILIEQLENLKDEREELSEAISRVRGECANLKQYAEQVESRHSAAERVVTALRDALREERASKNRVEMQVNALRKELKAKETETTHTLTNLRSALREKDSEIQHLKESMLRSTDTSALNVADYDVMQDTIDNEKIHYLTQTLVQRQGKIDSLLADNNMLKIQMDKMESKYKSELATLRAKNTHSVHLHEDRVRRQKPESTLSNFSLRIGVMMKRYPLVRIFIMLYMIGLHLWVVTVLWSSTPEGYGTRQIRK